MEIPLPFLLFDHVSHFHDVNDFNCLDSCKFFCTMAALEELFASMKLGVIVPETFHDLPDDVDENWLSVVENEAQREKAFFGMS
jgi:hypothetical protein